MSEAEFRNLPVPIPARVEADRKTVERGFWQKIRRFAGQIPFAEDAVAAFYCTRDPKTPWRVRAILLAALGFTDDAAVLALAIRTVSFHITAEHRRRAREALLRPDPSGGSGERKN